MSRRMYENKSNLYSGLVTGTMWDVMLKYMENKGVNVTTKSDWGNYDDVSLTNLRGYYTNVTTAGATDGFKSASSLTTNSETSSYVLLTTGSTEQVKKMNLYDVAGNLWEWTQETSYRNNYAYRDSEDYHSYMLRGGNLTSTFTIRSICFRSYQNAPFSSTDFGFRVALYLM